MEKIRNDMGQAIKLAHRVPSGLGVLIALQGDTRKWNTAEITIMASDLRRAADLMDGVVQALKQHGTKGAL